jgi:hypothetical protein
MLRFPENTETAVSGLSGLFWFFRDIIISSAVGFHNFYDPQSHPALIASAHPSGAGLVGAAPFAPSKGLAGKKDDYFIFVQKVLFHTGSPSNSPSSSSMA